MIFPWFYFIMCCATFNLKSSACMALEVWICLSLQNTISGAEMCVNC